MTDGCPEYAAETGECRVQSLPEHSKVCDYGEWHWRMFHLCLPYQERRADRAEERAEALRQTVAALTYRLGICHGTLEAIALMAGPGSVRNRADEALERSRLRGEEGGDDG